LSSQEDFSVQLSVRDAEGWMEGGYSRSPSFFFHPDGERGGTGGAEEVDEASGGGLVSQAQMSDGRKGGLEVRSWVRSREGICVSGLAKGHPASAAAGGDTLRSIPKLEESIRRGIAPELGFDLAHIGEHYAHRAAVRARYPALRQGGLVMLTAKHRFGEHENVLVFARTCVGEQVAVVACNFNEHSSVFSLENSPLASAFSATNVEDASVAVGTLMSASLEVGVSIDKFLLNNTILSSDDASPTMNGTPAASHPGPPLLPSSIYSALNMPGGVWEVRDVFRSGSIIRTLGEILPAAPLSDVDGPLVAIMASDEAAFAPITSSLGGHQSSCWMFSRGTPTEISTSMHWLFASSLLRLQSSLRLKEVGLTSAVVTRAEVLAAGSFQDYLASLSTQVVEKEWIQPYDILKDELVLAVIRHNLVYSILREVVKRALPNLLKSLKFEKLGSHTQQQMEALQSSLSDTTHAMTAALRILTVHWRLRESTGSKQHVHCEPLPSLNSSASSSSDWFCVNGEIAVILSRAALYLAVKSVAARKLSGSTYKKEASEGLYPAGLEEEGSEGGGSLASRLSALVLRALAHVSRRKQFSAITTSPDIPSEVLEVEAGVRAFARRLLQCNALGPIV